MRRGAGGEGKGTRLTAMVRGVRVTEGEVEGEGGCKGESEGERKGEGEGEGEVKGDL